MDLGSGIRTKMPRKIFLIIYKYIFVVYCHTTLNAPHVIRICVYLYITILHHGEENLCDLLVRPAIPSLSHFQGAF